MAKNIINQGVKPVLVFKCNLCECEWEDDKFSVSERPSPFSGLMLGMRNNIEATSSRCPTCNLTSYDGKKVKKESESI